jgi:hypothetical protein
MRLQTSGAVKQPSALRSRWRPQRLSLLAALGLFAVITWLLPVRALDLEVYWRAAQQVFVVGTEPYTRADDAGLPFTYPPTALFMLRPLAVLSLDEAANLLWALNLALAVLVIWLLPRDLARMPVGTASPPRRTTSALDIAAQRLLIWGPLYVACFGGLYLTLHFHQVNLLLLLCLWPFWRALRAASPASPIGSRRVDKRSAVHPSRGWISRRSSTRLPLPFTSCCRQLAAGASLALGSIAKPHYGLLLLGAFGCLRIGRRPGPGVWLVLGAALGGLALLWLSLIIAPAGSWAAWWQHVPGNTSYTALPPGHSSIAAPWNRSIAGEVARWLVPNKFTTPVLTSPAAAQFVTTILVLGLGLATAWAVLGSVRRRARRFASGHDGLDPTAVDLELSLIAVWVFLAAPASWTHHLVMLLPAALVLLRDAVLDPRAGGLGRLAAVMVLAVLALTLDDLIPPEVRASSRAIMALMTAAVLGLWALLLQRLLAQDTDPLDRVRDRDRDRDRDR